MAVAYPKSLFRLDVRGRRVLVLPVLGLKYLAVALVVFVFALLLLEKALIPALERRGRLSTSGWQRENEKIVRWYLEKNLATRESPIWRSKGIAVDPAKRTKAKRILVMGDSFVWGYGTSDVNVLWWRQLERELSRRGYHDVEVVAAGYSGWSTRQQLEAAKKLVPELAPDAVIWGYVTNDPDEYIVQQYQLSARAFGAALRFAQPWFPNVTGLLAERRARKVEAANTGNAAYSYPQWELKLLEGPNFEAYRRTVDELSKFMKSNGRPNLLLTLPNYPSKSYFGPRYDKVMPLFAAAEVPHRNVLEAFVAKYSDIGPPTGSTALVWGANPADAHPGPKATRFFAEQAADWLEREHPESIGAKSTKTATASVNDWMPPSLSPVQKGNAIELLYPTDESQTLSLPLGFRHVRINFAEPVSLAALRVSGAGLASVNVAVAAEDPVTHVDDPTAHEVAVAANGPTVDVPLDGKAYARTVTSIFLGARFSGSDRRVVLTLTEGGAP